MFLLINNTLITSTLRKFSVFLEEEERNEFYLILAKFSDDLLIYKKKEATKELK